MDENESTSKRGNSLNEHEREIANMDESDFFFLLLEAELSRLHRIQQHPFTHRYRAGL